MQSTYYECLGTQQKLYDTIVQGLQRRVRGITIPEQAQTEELAFQILGDHPELFYVAQQFRILSNCLKTELQPNYLYTQREAADLQQQVEHVARKIIREGINDHQSEYDKVRVLHDYLKTNVEYDHYALEHEDTLERRIAESHNIIGALLKHRCVCEGFAKSMKYLCDQVGITCWVVNGTGNSSVKSGAHAWNIVRINGYYHHVDVTWDIQYADSSDVPNYGYLNLSDAEIEKDHTWNRKHYPPCPDSPYNYFRINNALLDSRVQLENFLYNNLQMEEAYIMFRVVRGSRLEQEINGCLLECVERAAARCKYIRMQNFRYGGIPEQLTFFVEPKYET